MRVLVEVQNVGEGQVHVSSVFGPFDSMAECSSFLRVRHGEYPDRQHFTAKVSPPESSMAWWEKKNAPVVVRGD